VKNRASRWPLSLLAALASCFALWPGCGAVSARPHRGLGNGTVPADQNAQALAQLAQSAKENNQSLKELVDTVKSSRRNYKPSKLATRRWCAIWLPPGSFSMTPQKGR